MWTATLNFIGAALVLAFVAWLAVSAVRRRAFAAVAAALLAVVVALPSIGHAFEIRRSEGLVTVAADETIDDTLLAMGKTVSIDGNINGDLLAFGQEVTVRGNVTGNLVTGAQTITIEGTVGGSVIGGAEDLSFANARVGRDLYGFGQRRRDRRRARTSRATRSRSAKTSTSTAASASMSRASAPAITVSGAVEGDVEGYAGKITLLPSARVGGNVTAPRRQQSDDLEIAAGATVGGTVDTQLVDREQRRNHYSTVGYYFGQVVRLGGAVRDGPALALAVPRAARGHRCRTPWPSCARAASGSRPP